MAKNELHILKNFFYLLVLAENEIKKSLNKFDPWMSMVRLSKWLCQGNIFVLIFDLVQHVAPLFCSGHWHNYFLQLGQAVRASVQSIFLRCLCFQWIFLSFQITIISKNDNYLLFSHLFKHHFKSHLHMCIILSGVMISIENVKSF